MKVVTAEAPEKEHAGVLLIRADAGERIGVGHVFRCLALAQAWQDAGGRAVFLIAPGAGQVATTLRKENIEIATLSSIPGSSTDAKELIELSRAVAASWIVIDGYDFDSEYQRQLRDSKVPIVVIDDLGSLPAYFSNVVVNPNLGAQEIRYNVSRDARLLLGTEYTLLRREFRGHPALNRPIATKVRNILITMGGADPDNVTGTILRSVAATTLSRVTINVVIGPNNRHEREIQMLLETLSLHVLLKTNVPAMSDLIAKADLCITAGGVTCWECASLGVPMLVLAIAANQVRNVQTLGKLDCALSLGCADDATTDGIASAILQLVHELALRMRLSDNCRRLVDGGGAARVVQQLKAYTNRYFPLHREVT